MSGSLRLGKTSDSRSRKQTVTAVNVAEMEALKEELKTQGEFTDYLLFKGYSTSTTRRYVQDAEAFVLWAEKENIPTEQISYSDVLHYIQGKRNHVKQRTVSTNINSIKHYFNFLAVTDQSLENPTSQIQIKGVKRKTLYSIFSKQELEQLYDKFAIPDKNSKERNQNWFATSLLSAKRNKVILGMMIWQGLGTQELKALQLTDLKLREGKLFVAGTRRSNERELKLEAHQILDVMEYTLKTRDEILALKGKTSDSLLVSTGEGSEFNNTMQCLLRKLKKQNSKVKSTQQIRTSVITHWLKMHNLRQVQYMAGHRYVSSTEAYFVNDLDDLSDDIGKFHPMG